jgi:hypothetical protein
VTKSSTRYAASTVVSIGGIHGYQEAGIGEGDGAAGLCEGEGAGVSVSGTGDGDRTAEGADMAEGVSDPVAAEGSEFVAVMQPATRPTTRIHAPKVRRTAFLPHSRRARPDNPMYRSPDRSARETLSDVDCNNRSLLRHRARSHNDAMTDREAAWMPSTRRCPPAGPWATAQAT